MVNHFLYVRVNPRKAIVDHCLWSIGFEVLSKQDVYLAYYQYLKKEYRWNAHEISFFFHTNAKPSKRDGELLRQLARQLSSSINIYSVNS